MTRIQLILIIVLIFIFHQFTIGQTNQNNQFLKKLGVLDSLYSEVLKENRKIYVQAPANYNPKSDNKYPVIFILDGEILLPTVSSVHSFYSDGFMPEAILVAISNDNNRTRDLTTSKITEKYGMPFNEENGGPLISVNL